MKKTIITLSLVLVTALGYAQNSKGTYFVGITDDVTAPGILDVSINPSFAYFIKDGIAVGSGLSYSSFNTYSTAPDYSYVISPFLRNYINEKLFFTLGTDLGFTQTLLNPYRKDFLGAIALRAGVGYSFMLNKKIALEPVLAFQSTGFYSAYSLFAENSNTWSDYAFEYDFGTNNITFKLGLSLRL
jgi:hypothetical protein